MAPPQAAFTYQFSHQKSEFQCVPISLKIGGKWPGDDVVLQIRNWRNYSSGEFVVAAALAVRVGMK